MAYLLASIPYIPCLVRGEYLRDLKDSHGQFLEATAVAVMSVRGDSLHFQVVLHEPLAGCCFLLPIEALCTKPCDPLPTAALQPWDSFSSDIGICEIAALRRTPVRLIGEPVTACYRFTIASTGTDVADDPGQRKLLHVVAREDGGLGAYPNNRITFVDRALFGDLTEKPEFLTLTKEFRAERNAQPVSASPEPAQETAEAVHVATLNGIHSDPKERPDWIDRHG